MHGVWRRAGPQGSIVRNLTLHFCKRLFPRLEPVTFLVTWQQFYQLRQGFYKIKIINRLKRHIKSFWISKIQLGVPLGPVRKLLTFLDFCGCAFPLVSNKCSKYPMAIVFALPILELQLEIVGFYMSKYFEKSFKIIHLFFTIV